MSEQITVALDEMVREALELRFTGEFDPSVASTDLLDTLQHIRRRLDRVEELLIRATRLKARAQRASAAAQATADDAWDQAAMQRRTSPVGRGDEYVSARERTAEANLATIDQIHAARAAAEVASHCVEAVDVLRLLFRGLADLRQDQLAVLRALQFESTLDR